MEECAVTRDAIRRKGQLSHLQDIFRTLTATGRPLCTEMLRAVLSVVKCFMHGDAFTQAAPLWFSRVVSG